MDKDLLASLVKRFPFKVLPNGNIRTAPFRVAFCHVKKPRENKRGGETFEVTGLLPLGVDLIIANKALEASVVGEHGPKAMDLVRAEKIKWPIKDQAKMLTADGQAYDFTTPGAKTFTARSSNRPRVMDRSLNEVDGGAVYRGCWCVATIHTYAGTYTEEGKGLSKYVSIGLNNLQVIADDDKLGGAVSTDPNEEFERLDGTADAAAVFGGSAANGAVKDEYDFG